MNYLTKLLLTSVLTSVAPSLTAQVLNTSPTLPTSPPAFFGNQSTVVSYSAAGGTIYMRGFDLYGWVGDTSDQGAQSISSPAATLSASFSLDLQTWYSFLLTGTTLWQRNTSPAPTATTELLSLQQSGSTVFGPLMLRESPTLQSTGQETVADLGSGQFQVTSFFDVFTEISTDNGNTWIPANKSVHLDLQTVPEPAAPALLVLAASLLLFRRLCVAQLRTAPATHHAGGVHEVFSR